MFRLAPILTAACLLAGCGVRQPTASVMDVKVDDATNEGARVLVTIELSNPNSVELPLPHAHYSVAIEGMDTFSFTTVPGAALPPAGMQTISLPAAFASDFGVGGLNYTVSGKVSYQPPGQVRKLLSDYRVPLPTAEFKADGTFD